MPAPWEKYAADTAVAAPGPWEKYSAPGPWAKYGEPEPAPRPAAEVQADNALMGQMMAGAAKTIGQPPRDPAYEQQLADLGLTAEQVAAANAEAEASLREPSIGPASDPTLRERIVRSEAFRRMFGRSALEKEAGVGQPGAPGEIAGTLLKFTTPPPPLTDPIRAATDPVVDMIPNETARGVAKGVREVAIQAPGMMAGSSIMGGKAVLAAFAGDAVWHLPEQKQEFDLARREGRKEDAAAIATQAFTMGALLAGGAALGGAVDTVGARRGMLGEPAGRPANPDVIARNLAAPGTARPTEQRALASPTEGRQAAEVVFERVPVFNRSGEVVDVKVQPRIREIVYEEPQIIEPVQRFLKPDAEGGKLPEKRTGFQRTAEDFIEGRPEVVADPSTPAPLTVPERPAQTIEAPQSPATESPAANVRKGTEMPAETGEVTVGAPSPVPERIREDVPAARPVREEIDRLAAAAEARHAEMAEGQVKQLTHSSDLLTQNEKARMHELKMMLRPKSAEEARADILKKRKERAVAKSLSNSPEPGLISDTAAEAWADRTIAEGSKRLNTGLDPELFSAYVVKGAAHFERGARKFSDWARKMIAEHGEPIRPHLRRIFEEAQRGLAKATVDRDTLKQRKLAARGSVSKAVAPEHRERLKTGKESFYEPQDVGRVEDVVSKMTSEELGSVPLVQADGPQNIGIAAKLEMYRRLVAADQLDAAWRVIDETMKMGTSLGQLVNQFKLLRGATPDGVMVVLNRGLKEQGFDPIAPAETMRVRRLAEESIKANAKWKEAERAWKEAPTAENFKRVDELQSDAITADSILQEKLRIYQPRSLGNTLSTLFKGNLIAPISQARNVVGNTANLALRGGMRNVAVAVDAVDAMLRSRPRTRALVGVRGTKEALKAVGRSLPDAWDVLKNGGSDKDLSKAEARVGLRPLVALRDAISADILGPKRDGKTPVAQRLLMLLEGSPMGMHAAAQLRLLGAADKPFREAARARLITEHLKVADMNRRAQMRQLARDPSPVARAELDLLKSQDAYTSENVARAVKFPELFIDAKALERIDLEAATAVFQNKNVVSSGIHRALSGASPGVRFMFDTVVPFVTTPANVIGEWLSYNPALAAFNAGRHAVKGDARLSTQAVGKFVVGSMAFLAGQWLYQKGLVSPSLSQADEQQKARILSGQTMPASRLNVTGLQRALAGEDATWREGDDTRDILGAGGVLGAVFQTVTDVNRRLEREPEDPSMMKKAEAFGANYALLTAGYGVNQSFLKGTATLLEGLTDPAKTESWVATYLDGLSAIALPNTLNAISRATRQNKPELRGDSLDERLNNQIKARISGVQRLAGKPGADADLPLKRDLWGRPIPETPAGSNAYLAQFLDVTKTSRIPTDPVAAHIYSLWQRTADAAVIPTLPDANFSILGKRFDPLTRVQVSRLQELVGRERRVLAERIVENPRFYTAPAESQIAVLKRIWNMGNKVGGFKFYRENGDTLKSRSGPAGFEASN